MPSSARAAAISAALRSRLNSSSGTPRYTTLTLDAGSCRASIKNRAVLRDTAIAMSVAGASARSATFWNQGVVERLACSWTMVGSRFIAPAMRPNVVAP
jgi:hypothetical protein